MSAVVELANEKVPIAYVCRKIGMTIPDRSTGKSIKTRCPFGFVHADRGLEAAFRIYYDTNTAYCFAGCGFFTPVWLAATAWDRQPTEIAGEMLHAIGYRSPDSEQYWEHLIAPKPAPVDRAALAEALTVYCSAKIQQWDDRQFGDLSQSLEKCLRLLEYVETADDAWQWLRVSKQYMQQIGEVRVD